MRTFGACGGGANAPRAPPWLRACYYIDIQRNSSSIPELFLKSYLKHRIPQNICFQAKKAACPFAINPPLLTLGDGMADPNSCFDEAYCIVNVCF